MANILAVGNLVLDTILITDHFPEEDEELRADRRLRQPGGNAANSLYVLSQLGHQTSLVTTLAADQEARLLTQALQQRGIDLSHIQRKLKGATPSSYILLNQQGGSRTIVHYRDLPEVDFEHFAKIEIEAYDWLHFEGRNVPELKGMLNIARTFCPDTPRSLELEKPREGIEALLNQVNVLFTGKHYAQAKGHADAPECIQSLRELAPQTLIICTWGEAGAWWQAPDGALKHVPAQKVRVKDTLGAGDTFLAGVIHKLLASAAPGEAVRYGSELAARKCRQHGLDNLLAPLADDLPLAKAEDISAAKATIAKVPGRDTSVILIRDKDADTIKAYVNNCPHQQVPLNEAYKVDVNPFAKTLKCSVHDAWFKVEDGECVDGPCLGDHLQPFPIRIDEAGNIFAAIDD